MQYRGHTESQFQPFAFTHPADVVVLVSPVEPRLVLVPSVQSWQVNPMPEVPPPGLVPVQGSSIGDRVIPFWLILIGLR